MSKKICYVTTVHGTLRSFVLPIAKYLLKHTDWDISMICNYDEEFEKMLPSEIHYYPISMKRGISIGGIPAMMEMIRIFKREKFDLVQYSTPNASLYAALASKIAGIPVRLYCQWGLVYVGMQGVKRKIFKAEEKLVCRLSTWVEPDSVSNLNFAHSEGLYPEEKGAVIGNGSACGVNLMKFDVSKKREYREHIRKQYQIPPDAYVFGFVGRITRDKGINELLASFKEVYSTHSNTYLLMVGSLEAKESLNAELYQWSTECDHILYTGTTNVVEQYLSAMDCYVLPSYREGFGMGTIEAEAMELPVIVTDIPGPIDAMIPGVTGITVKKADPKSLQAAMEKMLEEQHIQYGKNGLKFVTERFEQKHLSELILEDRQKLLTK